LPEYSWFTRRWLEVSSGLRWKRMISAQQMNVQLILYDERANIS